MGFGILPRNPNLFFWGCFRFVICSMYTCFICFQLIFLYMHVYIYTVFIGFPYNLMHHFCSDLKLPFQLRSFVWLNLLLARRSFTVCLQWQWNCSAMWDYALVSSCKIDDSMPPRSSQHLQKPIKMDFLTSPIWTAWV